MAPHPYQPHATCVMLHRIVELESTYAAAHSPIIMAYPDAIIYEFSAAGIRRVEYRDTEHYRVTHAFLSRPEQTLKLLFAEDDPPAD